MSFIDRPKYFREELQQDSEEIQPLETDREAAIIMDSIGTATLAMV